MKFKPLLAALVLAGAGAVSAPEPAAAQFAPQVCHSNPQLHFHP